MIDFKEKVRKEAADILEAKEELNEADLKEWFWDSDETTKRKNSAESRRNLLRNIELELTDALLNIKNINKNDSFFSKKGLDPKNALELKSQMIEFSDKFDDCISAVTTAVKRLNNDLNKYLPNTVEKGRKTR